MRIVPVEKYHLEWLKNQRNKPEIMDYCRQPYFLTNESQEDWLDRCNRDRSMIPFLVCIPGKFSEEEAIGYVALSHIDWVSKAAEFSIFLVPEKQGNGIGGDALYLLLEYGFNTLGFQKIYSDCFSYNFNGIKFFLDFGFKKTGIQERHYFKRGRLVDAIIISMLREDFLNKYPLKDRLAH